jgi:plasmid maintenance system antidote protein VapI
MTIHEKLERLTRLMNRKAVCEAAAIGPMTLGNILHRKSSVMAPTALALARVLGVDPGWLIDDSKGWPPVRVEEPEVHHAA